MERITIDVDNRLNAQWLMSAVKILPFVKSVVQEKSVPLTAADWVRPGRPATDEELEQMISECEKEYKTGHTFTIDEAKALTRKKFAEWKKKNSR